MRRLTSCLADCPYLHVVGPPFALDIGGVGHEMRRLDRREHVELERDVRVPGAGEAMGDGALAVAEMAVEALLGAHFRALGRIHAGGDIGRVVGAGHVGAEPIGGAAMAYLAADPVGDAELRPAAVGRHVVGVAAKQSGACSGRQYRDCSAMRVPRA